MRRRDERTVLELFDTSAIGHELYHKRLRGKRIGPLENVVSLGGYSLCLSVGGLDVDA